MLSSQHLLEELCVAVCPHCVLLVSHHAGSVPASYHPVPYGSTPRAALGAVEEKPEDGSSTAPSSSKHLWLVSVRLELWAWPGVRVHGAGFGDRVMPRVGVMAPVSPRSSATPWRAWPSQWRR